MIMNFGILLVEYMLHIQILYTRNYELFSKTSTHMTKHFINIFYHDKAKVEYLETWPKNLVIRNIVKLIF